MMSVMLAITWGALQRVDVWRGGLLDMQIPKIKWIHPLPSCTGDIIWRRRLCSGGWKADPGYIESRPYGLPLNNEQRSHVRWEIDLKKKLIWKEKEVSHWLLLGVLEAFGSLLIFSAFKWIRNLTSKANKVDDCVILFSFFFLN